ncbi:MAG: hypothetical protein M1457_12895, partial [bacterium]|nr:hypothetical protein [bacterium]
IPGALLKDVVIYERRPDGAPDWAAAEWASVTAVNEASRTVTLRRWNTGHPWPARPAGAWLAPNAVNLYYGGGKGRPVIKPFLPNLTRFCPRDPRTGLNAAEWLARHWAEVKRRHYPLADGYVFDVSAGTYYPSDRVSARVDADNDGKPDGFFFDGIQYWPLGVCDFLDLLRAGLPGRFEGLGQGALLASDSNHSEDQRFFDRLNGAEYEFGMVKYWGGPGPLEFMFSSMLDRLLLWAERGRKPDVTYISNKYPDEAYHGGDASLLKPPMTLSQFRLDLASACMGSGYIHKDPARVPNGQESLLDYAGRREQLAKYRQTPPLDYDEFHRGSDRVERWLGRPLGPPRRVTETLGPVLYRFDGAAPLPAMIAADPAWQGALPRRAAADTLALAATQTGCWRTYIDDAYKLYADLPLPGVAVHAHAEYAVRFRVRGTGKFQELDPRYRTIPINIRLRLAAGGILLAPRDAGNPNRKKGFVQECFVFPEPREIVLTLIAPADGPAALHIDLSETAGQVEIAGLEMRTGCADVMVRPFEHGLALLNGSHFGATAVPLARLFPGERFRRIFGPQAPAVNDGQPVGETVRLPALDGLLLVREE